MSVVMGMNMNMGMGAMLGGKEGERGRASVGVCVMLMVIYT